MFVRNFFTKATAEPTGCFAFFKGSTLGFNAYFRGCFVNNFFYLEIDQGLWTKPYIRVKYFPTNRGVSILEVEVYNFESKLYEHLPISEKDRAFLLHIIKTYYAVLTKADKKWRSKIEKMEDPEIPF